MSATLVERGAGPGAAGREVMPGGIALSAVLHVGLIVLILVGLPSLFRPRPPQESPIAVDLVMIAPHTMATHPNPYRPRPEAKPEPAVAPPAPKPQPKPEPPAPAPPPSSSAAAAMSAPPEPVKPEVKAPPPPPPPPPKPVEAQAPPPPLPRPPEPKPKPPSPQARPAPLPETTKADTAAFNKLLNNLDQKQKSPAQFDALLKNLTQVAEADNAPPAPTRSAAGAQASSQPKAPLGSQLSASERDLIIQQIERCWVVPAGVRDADNLVIEVKAVVNPDGTVQQAMIVDGGRYGADPVFRAAADSAKRAVLNPQCSPLRVPPDKYEAWHNLDLFFNPKDLL